MATPHKPIHPTKECWGGLTSHIGYCKKKPRPNLLTCYWHRQQEGAAQRLKIKFNEEETLIATTCFYCGDPALPKTHGFDPRCERHYDV